MWVAAETGDLATALIPAVWTFLGIVVVTLGTIAVQARRDRAEQRNLASQPVPLNGNGNAASLLQVAREVARDIGQLDERANDNDERDDWQDKRHDKSEARQDQAESELRLLMRWARHHDPEWWR